ncbi:MAG: sodium:proton antiporter [Geminicoccaceae bacterium]|nr:sodium:proton antiporter [Geminicoccaceae bacterium]
MINAGRTLFALCLAMLIASWLIEPALAADEEGLATGPAAAAVEGEEAHGEVGAHAGPHLDGADLSIPWVIPFVGILLSIALGPLLFPHFWHHHFGKISALWGLAFMVPFALMFGFDLALFEALHVALLEYFPFIILLLSLFTVTGGLRMRTSYQGGAGFNTGLLAVGTGLASWMGTTGAAMLLIRPLLRANAWRRYRVHVVVFFIFLVANIGGSLTPLGDPPLFLGFLKGVDFFWTTTAMFLPMLLCVVILLIGFYALDTFMLRREDKAPPPPAENEPRFRLEGKINLVLLAGVVLAVLLSGVWKPGIEFTVYYVHVELQNLVRDLLLLALTATSWAVTPMQTRISNEFSWFPIVEVAKLFAGIFITIIPAIAILRAGTEGALEPVISMVSQNGEPVNVAYFWATGILSSFLDNAPTYLVFFNTAGGDAEVLMGPLYNTLLAISAGAVFMGANTYIGNAPNFMVRAIAEERGVPMPSFFGFMAWSGVILLPIFVVVTFVFLV